ncbi:GntR family transcriptional regulator [Photobacterium satsumensis]|uniref:GntR family transcriptional regulator n=1 Tax=Photobacterium satsumensis TaxID=2910239 RepID=UPI003D13E464
MIDKDSYKPAYAQAVDILTNRIIDGTYPIGSPLPSQKYLCQEFNISDIVIRKAWQVLLQKGIISSQRGVGTRVIKAPEKIPVVHDLKQGMTLSYDTKREFKTRILKHEMIDGALHVLRYRYLGSKVIATEKNIIYVNRVPGFNIERFLDQGSLYKEISQHCHLAYDTIRESIDAVLPDRQTADLLSINKFEPILNVCRVMEKRGVVIEDTEYFILSKYYGEIVISC